MLFLPHHVSAVHPQMSCHGRAAQFSPFAALTGYNAVLSGGGAADPAAKRAGRGRPDGTERAVPGAGRTAGSASRGNSDLVPVRREKGGRGIPDRHRDSPQNRRLQGGPDPGERGADPLLRITVAVGGVFF